MRVFQLAAGAALLAAGALSQTVDSYVASEGPIAKAGLLANIAPAGPDSLGAKVRVLGLRPEPARPACA
jgi:glucoamylase